MLIGTETEYGIMVPSSPDSDFDAAAEAVVKAYTGPATPATPDLLNRMLANGARFYVDHGHPEYATPETTTPLDATIHELAGDHIVTQAAQRASRQLGVSIQVFRNNTDGKGQSYGYHENYLLARSTSFDEVIARIPAFWVTRILVTGAGRVGLGEHSQQAGFQLSQRADFFSRRVGLTTTVNRGLINTRDEPHAQAARWRRLHVITGDANRNPFATWLKLGTASLVLAALEAGRLRHIELADPVAAFRQISRDLTLSEPLTLADGSSATALEIQQCFYEDCAAVAADVELPEAEALLQAWSRVLTDLAADPMRTIDRLDWPAKFLVIDGYRQRHALDWNDPRLARLDLAWAELSPASPFAALQRAGAIRSIVDPAAIAEATEYPPADTRAALRGHLVRHYAEQIVALTWDAATVRTSDGHLNTIVMDDPCGFATGQFDPAASLDRLCACE